MKCEKCGTEWEDRAGLPEWVACDCPICDNDDGETYLIESTTLDDWCY